MSQATMRGMRLGSQSLESERGVTYEPRHSREFRCSQGHSTILNFALDAEVPTSWECKFCSRSAHLVQEGAAGDLQNTGEDVKRSHWQMLLERRSIAELEDILEERLSYIRARRAGGKVDF